MPIRINLLAESQALEDMRRRDPVKRAIWAGGLLTALVLAYASSLQVKAMSINRDLSKLDTEIKSLSAEHNLVESHKKKLAESNLKLLSLRELSKDRFLNGPLLNALQKSTVDDVALVHLKIDESYLEVPEVPARTNG